MDLDGRKDTFVSAGRFGFDTTFVLFFLGLELGRIVTEFTFDVFLVASTLLIVAVLPYFLIDSFERPAITKWLMGRIAVAILGCCLGISLSQAIGTVLPSSVRFVPLTLLIAAAISSSFVQFYGLMRLRLAK